MNRSPSDRPPFEGQYLYVLALLAGYWMADLSTLFVRPYLLPNQPPPARPARGVRQNIIDYTQYKAIEERNIFNKDGKIPDPLSSEGGGDVEDNSAPVLSQLPLKLEGTMVHSRNERSVATINVKSKNETNAYTVGDDIEGMARLERVERRRAIFRNLNNNRREYIEIPKDTAVTFGVKETAANTGGEVLKRGDFDIAMKRSDVNKYISDLGNILQQARVVPNIAPGSGGRVDGFRFVAIQPGSIFEKLGFQPQDVIKKVNNEDVNSPTKAMELFNALKQEGRLQMTVNRGGRDETFRFDITE